MFSIFPVSDFIARHGHHSQQMEDFLREAKEMAKVDNHRVVKLIAVCTLYVKGNKHTSLFTYL